MVLLRDFLALIMLYSNLRKLSLNLVPFPRVGVVNINSYSALNVSNTVTLPCSVLCAFLLRVFEALPTKHCT